MNKLQVFKDRLAKIGISVTFVGNIPWIYIETINGHRVTERFHGNHGFTIAWYPVRVGESVEFTDITEIFNLIRKYKNK
jgi:hypothetical protein